MVAALLAATAILLIPIVSAHAEATFDGPEIGPASGALAGDFAQAADGSVTIGWNSGNGPTTFVRHIGPNGVGARTVTLGDALDGAIPQVATAPTGEAAIVWFAKDPNDASKGALRVTQLDAAGAVQHDTVVGTDAADTASAQNYAVAVDASGAATVAWAGPGGGGLTVRARRVAADGTAGPVLDLGGTVAADAQMMMDSGVQIAQTPGGVTWVGWLNADHDVRLARVAGDGHAVEGAQDVTATGDAAGLRLAASTAGGLVTWLAHDPAHPSDAAAMLLAGVRLPAGGALLGTPLTGTAVDLQPGASGDFLDAAIAPDGAITLLYVDMGVSGPVTARVKLERIAPGQSSGVPAPVAGGRALLEGGPSLGTGPDGTLLASWVSADLSAVSNADDPVPANLKVRRIAPDGALGSELTARTFTIDPHASALHTTRAFVGGEGGIVGDSVYALSSGVSWTLATAYVDWTGPTIALDVPPSAVVGTFVAFKAMAGDSDAVAWDFGDGSGAGGASVTHAYAGVGTYTVKATATDAHGNASVATRTLTITPAPVSNERPPAAPPVVLRPATVTPVGAALKVNSASRKGSKVVVSGTITSKATGKVTVAYAQKLGRKTITVTKTATIAMGRWKVTLTLPKALTRGAAARRKGTVTVTFAGSRTVKKASVKKTTTFAKATSKRR
jgi:PKD domain